MLNYGQSIFEGMKAYRQADAPAPVPASAPASIPTSAPSASSAAAPAQAAASTPTDGAAGEQQQQQQHILLFRPEANAARFEAGAARMCMPPVPPEMFLAAVHAVVRANADWVREAEGLGGACVGRLAGGARDWDCGTGSVRGWGAWGCVAGLVPMTLLHATGRTHEYTNTRLLTIAFRFNTHVCAVAAAGAALLPWLPVRAASAAGHGAAAGAVPRALLHLRGVRSARGRPRQGACVCVCVRVRQHKSTHAGCFRCQESARGTVCVPLHRRTAST